jgi:rubrerythrin
MALDVMKEKGMPLDRQTFDWPGMVQMPISKLDADAMTRVRIILMNGIENEAWIFQHQFARTTTDRSLREALARVRRVEQHEQTTVNWLLPADQSVLETTIGYEQVAVEVTAEVAAKEPDPYLRQVYEFGLLEDFDHLYRYSALLDRMEGMDANSILQCYTDVLPGRPTVDEHRAPMDDLRNHYDRTKAKPITKLNALTVLAAEQQTRNFYATVGPIYADPVARQLYAEISSIEEQHVTQYESIIDPSESWLTRWLLHEATEVWNYWHASQQESDARVKPIWERFLQMELGHLHFVMDLFRRYEKRDPAEVLPSTLPEPLLVGSHRDYVRRVLRDQVDLRSVGPNFVARDKLPSDWPSFAYQKQVNAHGAPSDVVAAGYRWTPGTELTERAVALSTH